MVRDYDEEEDEEGGRERGIEVVLLVQQQGRGGADLAGRFVFPVVVVVVVVRGFVCQVSSLFPISLRGVLFENVESVLLGSCHWGAVVFYGGSVGGRWFRIC